MHHVVVVTFPGFQSLDVAGPTEVFSGATKLLRPERADGYEVTIASLEGGVVPTESAIAFDTVSLADVDRRVATLLIPGGAGAAAPSDDLVDAVGRLARRAGRVVTVCTGASLAAQAGLLDGHRVTTHWARAAEIAERHPGVTVDPDPIFVRSVVRGSEVWSSAGVTAGIDLSLALVEHDHSSDIAQTTARWLVMFLRRPGGQSQFAAPTWLPPAAPGPVANAQQRVLDDPGGDHRVSELARQVGLSERHFLRTFTEEVGVSPARYVARVRVDAARQALESSDDTVAAIARRCGFGTAETMRRTMVRHVGVPPDSYRRRFTHHRKEHP
ncbi:MAG: GlxA family transcriptional regulator [Ilumatobacteraceae bacterium]